MKWQKFQTKRLCENRVGLAECTRQRYSRRTSTQQQPALANRAPETLDLLQWVDCLQLVNCCAIALLKLGDRLKPQRTQSTRLALGLKYLT
jgi:hypothetical protein